MIGYPRKETRSTARVASSANARRGYTLIELMAAMIAASVLLASLAGTIVITTQLLETPADDALAWRDRDIADRISDDLRYATTIDESPTYGFQVTKTNVTTNAAETATYESYLDGLTRQIDSGSVIALDENAASHTFNVDGYTAPTYIPNEAPVTVRAVSSAAESDPVDSITCDFPTGCQNGDLLLMFMAARTPNTVQATPTGWNALQFNGSNSLRLLSMFRTYDEAVPGPAVISFPDGQATAAVVILALKNAATGDAANWLSSRSGFYPLSNPTVVEPTSGTEPYHLNLQMLATNGNPWPNSTLGVASFADAVTATAGTCSIGVVIRNGSAPTMSGTPAFWQQAFGTWIQTSIRLGNGG